MLRLTAPQDGPAGRRPKTAETQCFQRLRGLWRRPCARRPNAGGGPEARPAEGLPEPGPLPAQGFRASRRISSTIPKNMIMGIVESGRLCTMHKKSGRRRLSFVHYKQFPGREKPPPLLASVLARLSWMAAGRTRATRKTASGALRGSEGYIWVWEDLRAETQAPGTPGRGYQRRSEGPRPRTQAPGARLGSSNIS